MRGTRAKFLRKVAKFLHEQRPNSSERKLYKALKRDYKRGKQV